MIQAEKRCAKSWVRERPFVVPETCHDQPPPPKGELPPSTAAPSSAGFWRTPLHEGHVRAATISPWRDTSVTNLDNVRIPIQSNVACGDQSVSRKKHSPPPHRLLVQPHSPLRLARNVAEHRAIWPREWSSVCDRRRFLLLSDTACTNPRASWIFARGLRMTSSAIRCCLRTIAMALAILPSLRWGPLVWAGRNPRSTIVIRCFG